MLLILQAPTSMERKEPESQEDYLEEDRLFTPRTHERQRVDKFVNHNTEVCEWFENLFT